MHAIVRMYLAQVALIGAIALTSQALAADEPAANPFLAAPIYGVTHFNPGQTDAVPYSVPKGEFRVDLAKMPSVPGGPINIMTFASARPGFMWAISTDRVAYIDARNGQWRPVAEIGLPGVKQVSSSQLKALLDPAYKSVGEVEEVTKRVLGQDPQSVTYNGLYCVVDRDDLAYVNAGTRIVAIGLRNPKRPADGLEVKRSIDARDFMPPSKSPGMGGEIRLIGMNMTYDGHLVMGAAHGFAVLDRQFKEKPVIYTAEPDQLISNSIAVDEKNGIYVASGSWQPKHDGIMRKLVWTGKEISTSEADGAWSSPYEGGDWPPAVKAGTGTGATPSLMGFGPGKDHLVVLTDGNNRMKMVAFWRDEIPKDFQQKPGTKSRRIAGQLQITAGQPESAAWVQSEQSVVVSEYGAFVVNNVIPNGLPDKVMDALALGPVIAPPRGVERVEWSPKTREWRSVWSRSDVISITMVPVVTTGSGTVFVNGYTPKDGWEVTGLDWDTGKTVTRVIFGKTNLGNGAYAILQFTKEGNLIFNSVGGPILVPLKKGGKL